jgi:hypothetical protein
MLSISARSRADSSNCIASSMLLRNAPVALLHVLLVELTPLLLVLGRTT